jgi:hypothetical protein
MKAPLKINEVYKRKQKQRKQKDKRNKKKNTHKDPPTAENPKHLNKNQKILYNITSHQPSYFCPE